MSVQDILKMGKYLFGKKEQVDALHQEIALNFYPERADFTDKRAEGEEFADHLFSSYPVLARRELGNIISEFFYSRTEKPFSIHVNNDELDKRAGERSYLELLTNIQYRAMYDPSAQLANTIKPSAHDVASFGNAVIKFGPNMLLNGMLYRSYHLRDAAWAENAEGRVDCIFIKKKLTARQLMELFPTKVSEQVKRCAKDEPYKEFDCYHVVLPSRVYPYKTAKGRAFPFMSAYILCDGEKMLEEIGMTYFPYVVPRWHKISGSVYGTSMATAVALPDGRTLQVVTRTIQEAGEKYVDPPMVAWGDAIRGDMALYAGGVTVADIQYDGKLENVLRPLSQDKGSFPVAFQIAESIKQDIHQGFFLNKFNLPDARSETTAFEIRQRIEEQIRAQAPLFDPLEEEFAELYKGTFQVMMEHGAFPIDMMPETLQGSDIKFSFRTPLSDLADERDAQIFVDGLQRVVLPAAQFDPAQVENVDLTEASRDALRAIGYKAKWFKPIEAVLERQQQMAEQAAQQAQAESMAMGSEALQKGGKGVESLVKADAAGS